MPSSILQPLRSSGTWNAAALLPAAFTQAHRLLELTTPLGSDRLLAETLNAVEGISGGGYCLQLTALADDAHIDLSTLVGRPARLRLRTALGFDRMRIWHGHVTAARFEAANGGFARYRLRIEPWLAFLQGRRDSFAFNDMTVFDVVESIFDDYKRRGALVPAWQWRVADRSVYTRRSLTTQYQETDLAFVERLLAEEGLFYWFEHEDVKDDSLGRHVLIIADHNDAFPQDPQGSVRLHRADVTEPDDTIQAWRSGRGWQAQSLQWSSWDYRSVDTRPVMAEVPRGDTADSIALVDLVDTDYAGQYAYEDARQGERLARNAAAARRVREAVYEGEGTVRTLAAGSTFSLCADVPMSDNQDTCYAVMQIHHQARNNFHEDMGKAVREALGAVPGWTETVDFYRNRFSAFSTAFEYRPANRDGHGVRLLPKPTVTGPQTAVVVGDGGPVHTDRDHRIKVQFHWQRGRVSSSRLRHLSGDENAPGTSGLGTWVRVAEALAGGDWGGHFLPRVGQEVLVEFMHGDIDRPVVVGSLFNGAGAVDAQYNRIQSATANATGNAPAWYAGERNGHGHTAVLSGVKTQALATSGKGAGGYSQLVFDDTPDQSRLELSTTQAESRLRLGHVKQQRDNERLADLGHGAELASQAAVAIRAGQGLLVSADARPGGNGGLLDSREAGEQLRKSLESVRRLAVSARAGNARLSCEGQSQALPVANALDHLAAVVAVVDAAQTGGAGGVTAYSEPHMQFSAPAGIAQYTPLTANTIAGATLSQVASDINWSVGKRLYAGAANGIVLYTRGDAATANADVSPPGLRLHAAAGKASVLSNRATLGLHANKNVTLASSDAAVQVQAHDSILATAGGAYLRVQGGAIQLHAPGKIELKAAQHIWQGPAQVKVDGCLPQGGPICEAQADGASQVGGASVPIKY